MPWRYRWRLLLLQPLSMLALTMSSARWISTKAYRVEYLKVSPSLTIRALVFKSPGTGSGRRLRPLHIDIHGGAFMGGWPEDDAEFCNQVARETGAVVVSISYRYAPQYPFPAAHDDVDATIRYLQDHAEEKLGADATLLTMSGFSAGGNLALAAARAENCRAGSPTNIKACVTFSAVLDLRLKPHEKPLPKGFPIRDLFAFLAPLYDCYPAPVRSANMTNPRMSPILASVDDLPDDMFVFVAGFDILAHEQTTFVERVKADLAKDPKQAHRRLEMGYDEKGFHGYLNLPNKIIPHERKQNAFAPATRFIKDTHVKYGFQWP
ncbi:Alpha/Beta hydrolase protein [Lasiosphaeris hirsuta]|uniref:Alpha/Beta hydrolase protein n=1 Tax=Lasiosphaeris hirsuta TaxID=260670 RepID=A0AA40E927_9PEZI|nr:Alpha/Beta hydrolase protein [Lasiosphaeris hirsuta]